MNSAISDASSNPQVRLRLTTREHDISLPDEAPILVPTAFRRYQLSTLINGLLEKEKPIPLEFVVNGNYLRTSLEDYLNEHGVSTETTLAIEYVRARVPPQFVARYEHDDWISDVDVLSTQQTQKPRATRVLTSSYDGHLRVWDTSANILAVSPGSTDGGHISIVKSARFISSNRIASVGLDRIVRIWKYTEEPESPHMSPHLELFGHKAAIESISSHADSNKLLSSSADHSVGLWSTRKSDAPAAPESLIPSTVTKEGKRRKLNRAASVPQRGPLAMMRSHTAPVSGALFDLNDPSVGYSASQDHTIRTWDLATSALVDTRTTNSVLFCIEQMPRLQLLACGSANRDIKLVDPRTTATTVTAMTLRGHKNHVVSLARDPGSEYGLLSGSHDGTCRVWDVRSTSKSKEGITGQSMYTILRDSLKGSPVPVSGEGVKIFGVCWDAGLGILSAGEDKSVQINSSESVP